MRLGFSLPQAGAWATAENVARVAQQAERHGYDSLWVFQRLLYPLRPKNDYPPLPGQPWPDGFRSTADPIVTLAYAAALTTRIRLGTSVLIMPYYSPVMLAKQLATLDRLCGGRLQVGLGLGWSEDEYDVSGVPFRRRAKRGEEFLRCLKTIWAEEVVEFQGEFYQIPPSRIEPKPLQRPHPPITVGGYTPAVVQRAVHLADGFSGGNMPFAELRPLVEAVRREAEAAGKDPRRLHIICRGTVRPGDAQGPGRRPLWGSLEEIREDIARYAEVGATELFLEGNFSLADWPIARVLDLMAALAPAPVRDDRGPAAPG